MRLATAGDDYELLFTAPPAATPAIERLAAELSLPITPIGIVEPGSGVRLLGAGRSAGPDRRSRVPAFLTVTERRPLCRNAAGP